MVAFGLTAAGVISGLAAVDADAQRDEGEIEVRKLTGGTVRTPQYEVSINSPAGREDWFELRTEYETDGRWLDDVSFSYFALFRPDPRDANIRLDPDRPFLLLRGRVTYINVPEGRHYSVMYIHPRTLERFGEVRRIAVVVSLQGRPVAYASEPSGSPGWWEQLPPVDGQLFNRHQTPFSMALSDGYEMIKAE